MCEKANNAPCAKQPTWSLAMLFIKCCHIVQLKRVKSSIPINPKKMEHTDYKQTTATSPKSTNHVTLDYQLLIFYQNLDALIIRMFHCVPGVRVQKWNELRACNLPEDIPFKGPASLPGC